MKPRLPPHVTDISFCQYSQTVLQHLPIQEPLHTLDFLSRTCTNPSEGEQMHPPPEKQNREVSEYFSFDKKNRQQP